jgi:hypothetical protein
LEPADIRFIGNAIGIISVDIDQLTALITLHDRGDAALPVRKQLQAGIIIYLNTQALRIGRR